jgi:hypothetical protein
MILFPRHLYSSLPMILYSCDLIVLPVCKNISTTSSFTVTFTIVLVPHICRLYVEVESYQLLLYLYDHLLCDCALGVKSGKNFDRKHR